MRVNQEKNKVYASENTGFLLLHMIARAVSFPFSEVNMPHRLHYVVHGTDKEPLGTCKILSSHGEISESQSILNLTENLFSHPLTFTVNSLFLRSLQPSPHLSPYQLLPLDQ